MPAQNFSQQIDSFYRYSSSNTNWEANMFRNFKIASFGDRKQITNFTPRVSTPNSMQALINLVCWCVDYAEISKWGQIVQTVLYNPGRGGQAELNSDQNIFEGAHVLGALKLRGLEKASRALLSGQWSRICLIIGHFVLASSEERQSQASLTRVRFKRPSRANFFSTLFFGQNLSLLRANKTAEFWPEPHWCPNAADQNQGVQLIATAGPLIKNHKKIWNHSRSRSFYA